MLIHSLVPALLAANIYYARLTLAVALTCFKDDSDMVLARLRGQGRQRPSLVLLDLSMPWIDFLSSATPTWRGRARVRSAPSECH
ncbi:hypothetical protein [Kutzneria sp. CA-103260]|uniref:hypothetical protein n=1 Tax=Kutzneria sp. CA-103260 TaxID=2802641 RepID=UPI001BAE3A04|nr:hypothetical protein [Kutzneria sp. CA-103260]QUQ64413.1 hypothetical protein JJ691_21330 [Kutzneria sp. CA-103260]